jgi:hypothetical protein
MKKYLVGAAWSTKHSTAFGAISITTTFELGEEDLPAVEAEFRRVKALDPGASVAILSLSPLAPDRPRDGKPRLAVVRT